MERIFDGKFRWNEEQYEWERADREQFYKGVRIVSVTAYYEGRPHDRHRHYALTWPDGSYSMYGIDKRGGNITALKGVIDRKLSAH